MKKFLATVVISVALVACGSGGDDSSSSGSGSTGSSGSGSTSTTGSTGNGGSSGSTGEAQPEAPTITSFTANPTALPPGGGDVTLSWSVDGAQTLDFEPGGINVTGLQSWTVTNVTANATFRLIATNAAGTSVASATVTVTSPSALTGTVVDAYGLPLAYQHVFVPGHSPTLTAIDGTFSVPDVVVPYALVVSAYDGSFTEIFDQLSDAAPVVMLADEGPEIEASYLQVSGPLLSQNPDAGASVYLATQVQEASNNQAAFQGSYQLYVDGPLVDGGAPGVALAVQTASTDDGGWIWDQVGSVSFTIPADGSPIDDAGITFVDANPFDVSVNLTGVAPNVYSTLDFGFQTGTLEPIFLTTMGVNSNISTYDTSLPTVQGLSPLVHVNTEFEDMSSGCYTDSYKFVSPGNPVDLVAAGAPIFATPIPGSDGLPQTGANFGWAAAASSGTAYKLSLYIQSNDGPESDRNFVVFTHSTQFTIPDLSALGLQLSNYASYDVAVYYQNGISSELELAKNGGYAIQDGLKEGTCEINVFVGQF